ncbi:MAG: F0F1 ATP synthase subunit A [Chitinophagaceae bacterium]|nr:F0F1 ATP synthase subunit A [Chitinophagaceae bacterium]MBK9569572.1 F0F1 ATP synthase subunit A [Chitinophagaceae bacterium]MBL0132304.1 F0F1 ATP synthase subunit A [Chitinophagaceae bacterium]MBL0271674.1 F0F1 ATP synthase subunit A [Chitinophagaceae bacterium]
MMAGRFKTLLVAAFSVFFILNTVPVLAQDDHEKKGEPAGQQGEVKKKKLFDANEVIFGHIMDAHEFHFMSYKSGGTEKHVTIPLPVILYSPQKGFTTFMSSKFHHGHENYQGYALLTEHNREELKLDPKKFFIGQIVPLTEAGEFDPTVKVYDISLTRNVVQMILALTVLIWIMLAVARRYQKGEGVTSAPKGMQNMIETMVNFVKDEVAKPNLGHQYPKYMPLLLTIFFFILINNIFGLIPGSANVTGNIAFTLVLAVISFVVIMFSSNKHYWGHIVWPPVPHWIKPILVPVEILGVFTKPFALMIRLFANMVAGHILIICLISLIFILAALNKFVGIGFAPLSIGFTVFIYFIEILVAFLQAFIFTVLTAVFIGQAFEGEHHAEEAPHA